MRAGLMIFRYHPSVGIFGMALSGILIAVAFLPLVVSEAESEVARAWGFSCCLGIGVLFGVVGFVTWDQYVAIKTDALNVKVAWFKWIVLWESLQHWQVHTEQHGDNKGMSCVQFYGSDNQDPVVVWDYEVGSLGFQRFLEEVRFRVGSKEVPGEAKTP